MTDGGGYIYQQLYIGFTINLCLVCTHLYTNDTERKGENSDGIQVCFSGSARFYGEWGEGV